MENKRIKSGEYSIKDSYVKTDDIFKDMCGIIESSQQSAYQAVNIALVRRNWMLGHRIASEEMQGEDDNPTIGIVLCADTDEDIARYSILHGNEQLFASKYKLYLPTEELRTEIETQKAIFYLQQKEKDD